MSEQRSQLEARVVAILVAYALIVLISAAVFGLGWLIWHEIGGGG